MSQGALVQFVLPLLAALVGLVAGWWLRGGFMGGAPQRPPADSKQLAGLVLQNLHTVAETLRACIEQHSECIRTIQAELNATTATEPAIITNAAASIIATNGLAQHQINGIDKTLKDARQEIRDCLDTSKGLLFTFASLDRQEHVYRQVLSSLETLAADLAGQARGHGKRLQTISRGLEDDTGRTAERVSAAVTQILDATSEVQGRLAQTEQRIAAQAETVHMQAILTHADLLTSLPNRRALEAELLRVAERSAGRSPLCTLIFVDLDNFSQVNTKYSHSGGDVVLRQAAAILKRLVRGQDVVARFGGDTFALLLQQTTLHDALPVAERARQTLEETTFSHGARTLRVTASVGIAQLASEEMRGAVFTRVEEALDAARQAGGNVSYRHDGRQCFPVSAAFNSKREAAEQPLSLAAMWRDSSGGSNGEAASAAAAPAGANTGGNGSGPAALSGRSLFAATLSCRLAEWKRGGASVSVALLRVDQMDALVSRFGERGQTFVREVLGRLLEATTRDMDERCEFEAGLFALLLPGTDEANALAVAERLRSQIRECKVRMGSDLWDLTASIGVAHCSVASRVMDIMLSAEAAMRAAAQRGGDAVCVGQPVAESSPAVV